MLIRIKGVKRVVAKGHEYFYHRKTMTRLPGRPGTTEFMDALTELDRIAADQAEALPGTLGALLAAYRSSPEFLSLADRTRQDYRRIFDLLQPVDRLSLSRIDRALIYEMRDRIFAKHKRRWANYTLQILRSIFNWAKRRGLIETNPAADVELIRRPRNAATVNRPWTDAEAITVMKAASPPLRVAIALGLYLGLRKGDVLRAPWSAYDGTGFSLRQAKTGEPLWLPVHHDLRAILDAAPRTSPVIVVGVAGKPYAQNGFQSLFAKLIRKLKTAGQVGDGLTFHGLRHTVGKRLAEAGCDARTIAAILGHRTSTMAEHYSRDAERKHLAREGMAKLDQSLRKTPPKSRRKTP